MSFAHACAVSSLPASVRFVDKVLDLHQVYSASPSDRSTSKQSDGLMKQTWGKSSKINVSFGIFWNWQMLLLLLYMISHPKFFKFVF